MSQRKKLLTVLGATGSIGVSTLDVVARHPDRYGVFALTAHRQVDKLFEQCCAHRPAYAVLDRAEDAQRLQALLDQAGCCTEVLVGPAALADVASAPEVDMVMAAIVGAAGLVPTLAAARRPQSPTGATISPTPPCRPSSPRRWPTTATCAWRRCAWPRPAPPGASSAPTNCPAWAPAAA